MSVRERAVKPFKPAQTTNTTIPGDLGLPVIGHTFDVLAGRMYTDRSRYDRFGPVHWSRAFGRPSVNVIGPDAAGEVLLNRDRAFANGPGWDFFIGKFFPRGLMLLDFEEHHRHRRIMQQAFTNERLAGYLDPMNAVLADGIAAWGHDHDFRVYPALKQLTLDVATRTFMGGEIGSEADRINQAFTNCVRAATAIVRYPVPGLRWKRGLDSHALLVRYLREQLPAKRASDGADLFSALCHAQDEDGARFTDEDIVNHMIFLLMAAHDTTTITMTTMAYYLAKNTDWQDRCRAESIALGTPTVPYGRLNDLVSLDLVMKECMRLVTAVPGVSRMTVKDTTLLGHRIPANTHISVNMHLTQNLDEYWPDPTKFDPERFAEHRREDKVHRYAWIPFGGGVHKCIGMYFGGMQVKAAMHQLLLSYRWDVPAAYEMPIDWTSLPRPKDGLPIRLAAS
jgi:cytochrome P450